MEEKLPFPENSKARKIVQSMFQIVKTLHNQNVMTVLNPRNVQRMYHGINWRTHSGDASAKETSTMEEQQIEHMIKFEDVVAHRLDIIPLTIRSIVDGMRDQLMRQLYLTVSESTERSGNVVSAKETGSNPSAFLEMLKKIEFGVDETGEVSLPEVHLPPGSPLLEQLQNAGPEFEAQVEAITQEKTAAALEKERERLSKFKA